MLLAIILILVDSNLLLFGINKHLLRLLVEVLRPQDQTYSLDGNVNGLLTQIFREYPLPVAEQNSLIELFALTGEQKTYQNPDIPYFNPELLRSWRETKPSITLS